MSHGSGHIEEEGKQKSSETLEEEKKQLLVQKDYTKYNTCVYKPSAQSEESEWGDPGIGTNEGHGVKSEGGMAGCISKGEVILDIMGEILHSGHN